MKKIKLFDPHVGRGEEKAIVDTLYSKFWASGAGIGKVLEFEEKFRRYVKASSCVAVNSGTAALHLALSLFDIKGKEVILPSLSFVSTAHAVLYNGGIPIFADIREDTLCLDPESVRKKITKKTKIILPVHFGGFPCDMKQFLDIKKENKINLVEDAAHAAGASYNNEKIGEIGDVTCFSFHPVKNLAMPSGGAITLNGIKTKQYVEILRSKRWCGITNRKGPKYDVSYLGWNYYMSEFSAAIGIEQLKKLDKMNDRRRKIAKFYDKEINTDRKIPLNSDCSYHLYWIMVKNRDYLLKKMNEKNVELGIHYKPIHTMKLYNNKTKLPVTENAGSSIITIPIHPNLTQYNLTEIVKLVNKYAKF
jgi:dTDP-4-amino-4,6-dideoxygalactose transaminase